jgi:peptidoglycan/LPS O-acetylase OafA/YrhL
MLASGYLMGLTLETRHRTFMGQIRNRVKRLLRPWFCTVTFWLVPLYTFFDLPANNRPAGFTLAQTYQAGLTGLFNDHLWFLLLLFWVSLFWLAVLPLVRRTGIFFGFALAIAISLLIDNYGRGLTWYVLWQTPGQIIYFYLGYCLYHYRSRLAELFEKKSLSLLAGNLFLFILSGLFIQMACFSRFQNLTRHRSES